MPSALNIALVEDHEKVRNLTARFLRGLGHHVLELECAEDMEEVVGGTPIHLFIVDLNLPGEDGLSFAGRLRSIQPQVGIIMMTARGSSDHMARGYRQGADIYLVKPISPEVLSAAIDSVQRRLSNMSTDSMALFHLDTTALLLQGPLGKVSLNPAEAALLVGLLRSPTRMLDVYQISALMGQKEETFNQASLVVRIVRLRKKLIGIGAERDCIKPQRMAGYQLCIPLEIR